MYVLVVVDVAVDVVAVSRATNATGAVTTAIVSSSISTFSSKAGAASDWHGSSSNETVNYLSYSRHAGFAVPLLMLLILHHKFLAYRHNQSQHLAGDT